MGGDNFSSFGFSICRGTLWNGVAEGIALIFIGGLSCVIAFLMLVSGAFKKHPKRDPGELTW